MKHLRLMLVTLSAGIVLTTVSSYCASAAPAQQKDQTTQTTDGAKTTTDGSKTTTDPAKTPTGFPTGTICTKAGTYKAANQYLEVIIALADGETFPPFVDGQKTTWYALTPSTKTSFEPVKVAPGTN